MRNEGIHCSNETMYRGNRVWLGWSYCRLSFSFLIKVGDMAGIGMTSWSHVMNALEQDFSGIEITSLSNVFLGEKVPRFIVSQVSANKSVDLLGRLKATTISQFANVDVAVFSAMPEIDRKMSYSGKGWARATMSFKTTCLHSERRSHLDEWLWLLEKRIEGLFVSNSGSWTMPWIDIIVW